MSKEVLVIILAILTGLTPFMGLPGDLRTIAIVTISVITVIVGFFLRSEALARGGGKGEHFFVDNRASTTPTAQQMDAQSSHSRIQ